MNNVKCNICWWWVLLNGGYTHSAWIIHELLKSNNGNKHRNTGINYFVDILFTPQHSVIGHIRPI